MYLPICAQIRPRCNFWKKGLLIESGWSFKKVRLENRATYLFVMLSAGQSPPLRRRLGITFLPDFYEATLRYFVRFSSLHTVNMKHESLPYWLVNVPRDQWPIGCPEFLVNANAKDRGILSTPDSEYSRQTWEEVQQVISTDITFKYTSSSNARKERIV